MGCSIGGRIVLDLALKHAKELRALIGLQIGAYVERYYDPRGSTIPRCTAAAPAARWPMA